MRNMALKASFVYDKQNYILHFYSDLQNTFLKYFNVLLWKKDPEPCSGKVQIECDMCYIEQQLILITNNQR